MNTISLGLDTFGDVSLGPDGKLQPMDQVLRDVVDQAVLADDLGIDFIGLGEHHRDDFAISAPEIVLATIAGRTRRIKLGTAVTVLSTDDTAPELELAGIRDPLAAKEALRTAFRAARQREGMRTAEFIPS